MGNGYEVWQTSLLYMFVSIFGLDRVQTTIDFDVSEQLANGSVPVKIFNCSVNVKAKDCTQSRPFQYRLQHNCFHSKVS